VASPGAFYGLLHAPREHHEAILRDALAPLAARLRGDPALHSLFFVRANKPDWHLRLAILGAPNWIAGAAREPLDRALRALGERGLVSGFEECEYDPEEERFGGAEGARIAERLFLHDTLACLDLLAAEARRAASRSRREYSLLFTERLLDLLDFDRAARVAFYRHGYAFQIDLGRWQDDDLEALDRHYSSIRDDLLALVSAESARDPQALWGGADPARIAARCLADSAPLLDELREGVASGRIGRPLADLVWYVTHLHANRLQIEANAEAIVRYFMHRLHAEGFRVGA
jgi:thiopeptide-type bacteriocin biosynthesis protein